MIDRVDEQDNVIGQVQRGQALELGANFRTVHVFVIHEDKLLLQLLAPTRERHPERWGSSVAAYLNAAETYEEAAQRRLWEELGLDGPLRHVGKSRMEDEQSLKFIELYTLEDGPAEIREPDHIEEIRYWDRPAIEQAVVEEPEILTPTFVHLYEYFEQRLTTAKT